MIVSRRANAKRAREPIPAEGVRLITPPRQKSLAVGNGLLPAIHRH